MFIKNKFELFCTCLIILVGVLITQILTDNSKDSAKQSWRAKINETTAVEAESFSRYFELIALPLHTIDILFSASKEVEPDEILEAIVMLESLYNNQELIEIAILQNSEKVNVKMKFGDEQLTSFLNSKKMPLLLAEAQSLHGQVVMDFSLDEDGKTLGGLLLCDILSSENCFLRVIDFGNYVNNFSALYNKPDKSFEINFVNEMFHTESVVASSEERFEIVEVRDDLFQKPIKLVWRINSKFAGGVEYSNAYILQGLGYALTLFISLAFYLLATQNRFVKQRIKEKVSELKFTEQELNNAHKQLVETEKIASLGRVVTGVAHELNTPLGNAITTASIAQDKIKHFEQKWIDGALTKSYLNQFLQDANDINDILLRSLSRCENLVKDFKKVAVNQTSERRLEFNLHEEMHALQNSYKSLFVGSKVKMRLSIDDDIYLNGYPGLIGQIFLNITQNALIHAFHGGKTGNIEWKAVRLNSNTYQLTVTDNGVGIPKQRLNKIFDPFYTTKLGEGGSGLGMHIVHNIVVGILGGSISVESQVNRGTKFTMILPITAPLHETLD